MDGGSEGVHNEQVVRNQRPVLAPWNQFVLVLPYLGKRFCSTQKMTW